MSLGWRFLGLCFAGLVACGPAAAIDPRDRGTSQARPAGPSVAGCPAEAPSLEMEGLPRIALPPGARPLVVPTGAGARVDLSTPLSVEGALDFFVRSLPRDGHRVVSTDYEGFEAEVHFATAGGRKGLVWILMGCSAEGTTISIRMTRGGSR